MNEQLGTNMITWLVIFPLFAAGAVAIAWFVIKTNVSSLTRVGLVAMGVFAFIGFTIAILGVYYHTNDPFSAGFKAYAYTTLAPDYAKSSYGPENHDPFNLPENGYGPALMTVEVANQDGNLRILRIPSSSSTFGAQLFTPGDWTTVNIDLNDGLSISPSNVGEVMHPSLWWALTKDIYRLNAIVN